MKKLTVIEITVVLFALITFMVYLIPHFLGNKEDRITSQIKASNAIFTSKIIEEFAVNNDPIPSLIIQKTIEELNKTEKNPYNRQEPYFQQTKDKSGCSNIEYDDNSKMIILTTLDKQGELAARIVIKPPSYVSYYKADENKNK